MHDNYFKTKISKIFNMICHSTASIKNEKIEKEINNTFVTYFKSFQLWFPSLYHNIYIRWHPIPRSSTAANRKHM